MADRLRDGRDEVLTPHPLEAFIQTNTRIAPVPFVPEIRLHQAGEATTLWHMTESELSAANLPPPFWAFAWAGGRGLARYILDHPETVRGRRVVDFASGSGLVAIAAAFAGATRVTAIDIDEFAAHAIRLNAAANGVSIEIRREDPIGGELDADILLAGDIFYDGGLARRVEPWFRQLALAEIAVLIGDPERAYCPRAGVDEQARYSVPAEKILEDSTAKTVRILAWPAAMASRVA